MSDDDKEKRERLRLAIIKEIDATPTAKAIRNKMEIDRTKHRIAALINLMKTEEQLEAAKKFLEQVENAALLTEAIREANKK